MRVGLALISLLAVGVAGCGGSEDAHLLPPGRALAVSRSFAPSLHLFGDPIVARFELVVDRRLLDPDLVRLSAEFEPYERVGTARRSSRDYGPYIRLRYEYELSCLTIECIPELASTAGGSQESGRAERRTFRFPPASILYEEQSKPNPSLLRFVPWPPLVSVSRVTEAQAGAWFPYRASPSRLPALSQRVGPLVLAGALFVVALGLLVWPARLGLGWWRGRRPQPDITPEVELSPLERALQLVEWACQQPDGAEHRQALERLASELGRSDLHELDEKARELAWSRSAPSTEATADLVKRVRENNGASP